MAAVVPTRRASSWPRFDARQLGAVFVGGGIGTLVRAALSRALAQPSSKWPWTIFVINIGAALLLGYFVTRLQERLPLSSFRRPLLGTGVCGGLSTFSTMQVELFEMARAGLWGLAARYAAASIVCGYLAIAVASAVVRRTQMWR